MMHPQGGRPDHRDHYRGGDGSVHSFLAVGFAVQGHAVELQAVADEPVAGLFRDPALQFLDLVVVEFDDLAALDVDQMVVVLVRCFFIARAAIAEIVLGENRPLPRTGAPSDRR